jgi:hypothetical protein
MKATLLALSLALAGGGVRPLLAELGATNTVPVAPALALAPFLQLSSQDSMAISWHTESPAYGWVEYGETKALGTRQDASVHGLRTANVTEHRVVLSGLRPGATYWYRVVVRPIRSLRAYKVEFDPEQATEPVAFQMLPGPQQPVTAVVFNDLHNGTNTFASLRRVVGDTPFDFTVFNGDCLADPAAEKPARTALAAYTSGAQADRRPTFFLRGNHETRGTFARELPRWLTWPGGRPYFAFTAGPVRWVVLDCGEDKPDKHPAYAGLVDFDGFRRAEAAWLQTELASPAFHEARWRVLVHHIPLYRSGKEDSYSQPSHELWAKLPGMERVDIALDGHTHSPAFHPANSIGNPYPIAVGGGPAPAGAIVMILEADQSRLQLRMLNVKGEAAFPTFEKQH